MRTHFTHENLLNFLCVSEPDDYRNFLRMDSDSFDYLLELVRPDIEKEDTNMREAIPARQRLSVTLRYLASGMDLEDLKFTWAIAPQTLEFIIMETCSAITKALKENIQVPKSQDGWKRIAQEFEDQWNFPNRVGSADGKHVAIQKPRNSGSYYYNYKGYFSIILMAIVDANYKFVMVDVGANGPVSDGGAMKNTLFWRKLSENQLDMPDPRELPGMPNKKFPFAFVGDEAFQLLPNFMKPYNRAALTNEKTIFNYRLSRARRVVENAFGIITNRFKIFQSAIIFEPQKVRKIVMACCHLHNYLCTKNRANYLPPQEIDREDIAGAVEPGSWRENTSQMATLQRTKGNSTVEAKRIRDDFCEFFNTSGAVPWQVKYLN